MNPASQSLGQMPAGDNGESSYRFQFNPGDWYQKERQHNIHRLQHNDFIDVFEHCSFHGLLTWSGAKANLLNVFYRRNRTSLEREKNPVLPILSGFLISACMPSGDRIKPSTYMPQVTLNITEPVVRDTSIYCKLFQRVENGFVSARTACVL